MIAKKPNWVTISCGMNDVMAGAKGVPLDQFRTRSDVDRGSVPGGRYQGDRSHDDHGVSEEQRCDEETGTIQCAAAVICQGKEMSGR